MKGIPMKLFVIVLAITITGACTDKKLENNIKSLEKRVAALEKRSGIAPVSQTSEASNSGTQAVGELPVMSFESTEYDFGTVDEGEVVEYTFRFTNTGKAPLLINKATATCGCTVPKWPKQPVGVGEAGVISVKFNTTNKPNMQTKYVNINANTKPEITRLKISGNVIPSEDSNS
jgi:hypothetical protein